MPREQFPRPGFRILPKDFELLFLTDVVEPTFTTDNGVVTYSDLNADIWKHFNAEQCKQLNAQLNERLSKSKNRWPAEFLSIKPSEMLPHFTLEQLTLSTRTYQRLKGHVLKVSKNEWQYLNEMTLEDLLSIPGFGISCLIDYMCSLEVFRFHAVHEQEVMHELSDDVHEIANRLLSNPSIERIRIKDVRLRKLCTKFILDLTDGDATTIRSNLHKILDGKHVLWPQLHSHLVELEQTLLKFENFLIEEEFQSFLEVLSSSGLRRTAVELRYGWSAEHPKTLQQVGDQLYVTRERVRQLTSKFEAQLDGLYQYAPVLEKCLSTLSQHTPISEADAQKILLDANCMKQRFKISSLLETAKLFGIETSLVLQSLNGIDYVTDQSSDEVVQLNRVAIRLTEQWGAFSLPRLVESLRERYNVIYSEDQALRIIENDPTIEWLDQNQQWFWCPKAPRNRVVNQIKKILSVSNFVHIVDLDAGVRRNYRMDGYDAPKEVLSEICTKLEFCHFSDDRVTRNENSKLATLAQVESTMAGFFPVERVVDRESLEKQCISAGMNKSTFYVYLGNSPIFSKVMRGIYRLRGTLTNEHIQKVEWAEKITEESKADAILEDNEESVSGDNESSPLQTDLFDLEAIQDERERVEGIISARRGQAEFRENLLNAYEGMCAISGCDAEPALEAAHIVPYSGSLTNHVQNGLLLRADIHTLFDLGHIWIDVERLTVCLSSQLKQSCYAEFENRYLTIPEEDLLKPSIKALMFHKNTVAKCHWTPEETD